MLSYTCYTCTMLSMYENDIRLCFTDTDSLLYEIKTADVFQDMAEHIDDYDVSDYPKDYYLYNTRHKKEIGKFKDELNGMTLEEFIGLNAIHATQVLFMRPKCYSLLFPGEVKNNKVIHTNITEK